MVAVTLVSRAGHFRQAIDPQGRQAGLADGRDPACHATRLTSQPWRGKTSRRAATKP